MFEKMKFFKLTQKTAMEFNVCSPKGIDGGGEEEIMFFRSRSRGKLKSTNKLNRIQSPLHPFYDLIQFELIAHRSLFPVTAATHSEHQLMRAGRKMD